MKDGNDFIVLIVGGKCTSKSKVFVEGQSLSNGSSGSGGGYFIDSIKQVALYHL